MTYTQSVKLKEMGFPRNEGEWFYDSDGEFLPNPNFVQAYYWIYNIIRSKYDVIITNNAIVELNDGEKIMRVGKYDGLSDAVYALIVWAYENKLLEA
jgi:hypothetical protein